MLKKFKKNFIFLFVLTSLLCIPRTGKTQEQSMWEDLGVYGGQITSIAVDPVDSSTIYAGTWGGDGFFKSIDSGKIWSSIPLFKNRQINDIGIDPNNPSTVWVAEGHYIDVSYDYGEPGTWYYFSFAYDEGRFCYTVAVDPHDPTGDTVYVGTGGPDNKDEYGEIFITTDGGNTWEKIDFITGGSIWYNFWDITFNPNQPGEVWVANRKSFISPNGYIYVRPNYNETWWYWPGALETDGEYYPFGYLDEVLVHPENPLIIFTSSENGIARKLNGSSAKEGSYWYWTDIYDGCRAMCIPPTEPDTVYAGLFDKIAKSTDAGDTWDNATAPSEFLSMKPDPSNADIIYGGSVNRGAYKTLDGAQTWETINNGIKANTIYDTDLSPEKPSTILCGTISGVYITSDSRTWKMIEDSAAEAVSFHPQKENIIYAGLDWEIKKTTDSGSTWVYVSTPDQEESNGVSSIAVIPHNDGTDTVLAGINYSSGNKGEILKIVDWEFSTFSYSESVLETDTPVNAVVIHPENSDIIFAGTGSFYAPVAPGGVYVSKNGGNTWEKKTLFSFQRAVVNSISISPAYPDIVYIGCGGSDAYYSGIYKSTNGGDTWEKKINGLPLNFAVSDIKVDSQNSDIVYAALYKGFDDYNSNLGGTYVTLDGGNYWTQVGLSDYQMYDINSSIADSDVKTNINQPKHKTQISFPSSNIIAGTASGLFKSSTSGTGIITGSITSQGTGQMLDGAVVSSTFGSNCISAEGYYMLLVPAGVHTLKVQAAGYVQSSVPTVTVSAGQGATQDIIMAPVTSDNDTGCLASLILDGSSNRKEIPLLRQFRDRVLMKSTLGKHLTSLYYTLGSDVWHVLQKHPDLKRRCVKLLLKFVPIIRTSLSKKNPRVTSSLLDDLNLLLFDLQIASPPGLKKEINRLRMQMRSFKVEKLFLH